MKIMVVRPKDDPAGFRVCKVVRGKGINYDTGITLKKDSNLAALANLMGFPEEFYSKSGYTKEQILTSQKGYLRSMLNVSQIIDKKLLTMEL